MKVKDFDEALELAKTFSSEASVAFVNGVLDGIRKALKDPTREVQDPRQE